MAPKSTPQQTASARRFRRRLLAWFGRHARELPWRRTRDPYRILVSEVMLQQTPVSRVVEYYPRFLAAFPSLRRLAGAPPQCVREAWQGLGYYRRATNLQRLAHAVVAEHNGRIPPDLAALRELPGVGRYTAGAVASFAFEQRVPAVDTNVARVLRRAFQPRPASGARGEQRLWEIATALLPRHGAAAWRFNQAIMELGALICTARVARCERCPVVTVCRTGKKREPATVNREREKPARRS
ncbi:MAG TPA: A/G-specific adenine glycosylase [Gemmatimonadales bacterium]|nr:A/G-specific adenine glycosylase [Gemmatimonadales bacterium]